MAEYDLFLQNGNVLHLAGSGYDKNNNEYEFSYAETAPSRYETINNGLIELVQAFKSIRVLYGLPLLQDDRVKLEDGTFYVIANIQEDKSSGKKPHSSQFLKYSQEYQIYNLQRAK